MASPFCVTMLPRNPWGSPRRSIFETRSHALSPSEAAIEQEHRNRRSMNFEQLPTSLDVVEYLSATHRHISPHDQLDPWKTEQHLLSDLVAAKRSQDHVRIELLRGLLRAGSWFSYPRPTTASLKERMRGVRMSEETRWSQDIRSLDPDTAKERIEDRDEFFAALASIDRALFDHRSDELDRAIELVERMQIERWHLIQMGMAAHGIPTIERAKKSRYLADAIEELELLRPIRDELVRQKVSPR